MNPIEPPASLSPAAARQIDRICDRFEARWQVGQRPRLEDFLDTAEQPVRSALLRQLLLVDWDYRLRAREAPLAAEYHKRFPDDTAVIDAVCRDIATSTDSGDVGQSGPAAEVGPIPRQFGEYRLVREVGRGGMGVVYEAVQESLGRHVALKVLPFQGLTGRTHLERFRREARAAARLHHTNIVPVYFVGEDQGLHYYAMQFIQGQGLDEVFNEVKRLRGHEGAPPGDGGPGASASVVQGLLSGRFASPRTVTAEANAAPNAAGTQPDSVSSSRFAYYRAVAQVGLQVAEALEHAHRQGIVHRDIKPSNLLLDTQGTVWVTDFGLARVQGSDELTSPGDIVGTLRFMAPERFEGQSDSRSDVYSLGVTLYELVTLRPAFVDTDRARLIERVTHEEPPRPRQVDRQVPRDLETILLKAMDKEPARRYATAGALAEDLRRFLADRPIRARPISNAERLWRWCRRNPAVAGLLAALVLVLAGGFAGVTWKWREAEQARQEERQARIEADRAREQIREGMERLIEANRLIDSGRRSTNEGQWAKAAADFARAIELRSENSWVWTERGQLYLRLGLWEEAAADFVREFELNPHETADHWYEVALLCWHTGNGDGYRRVCAHLLERCGQTTDPYTAQAIARACALAPNGVAPPARVVQLAQQALAGNPGLAYRRYVEGMAHYRAGQHEQAIRRLRESLNPEWPNRAISYPILALAHHRLGQFEEARQALANAEEALDAWSRDAVKGMAGFQSLDWWDWLECQSFFREAWTLIRGSPPPDDPTLGVVRGHALAALGQTGKAEAEYVKAAASFSRALELRADHWSNWYKRGHVHANLGQWDRAAADFARVTELRPDDPNGWKYRARVCLAAGDREGYRRICARMLERLGKQEDAETANVVAWTCSLIPDAIADPAEAVRWAEKAVAKGSGSSRNQEFLNTLGVSLYRAGKFEAALQRLHESIRARDQQGNALDWLALAMVHHHLGQATEARQWLDKAVRWIELVQQGKIQMSWTERVSLQVLRREAEALIK